MSQDFYSEVSRILKADEYTGDWYNRVLKALEAIASGGGGGGGTGKDGREVELRNNGVEIQWRYVGSAWQTLILLSALKGEDGQDGSDGAAGADGAPGQDGIDALNIELHRSATAIQWRYIGEANWVDLVLLSDLKGEKGDDGSKGQEIELSTTATHVVWKYVEDSLWLELISFEELKGATGEAGDDGSNGIDGREIELSVDLTNIYWRYVGDVSWTTLIPLSALKGEKGDTGLSGINWRGEFETGEIYNHRDAIRAEDGNAYYALIDGITNPPPSIGEWSLMVVQGAPGETGSTGSQGEKGDTGKSVYDAWLESGKSGTEEDFLRWVKASAGGNANIGEIFWWPLVEPPGDALVCDGRDVSREEYAELFEVIGTQFGAGDGESTFGLPDIPVDGGMYPCVRYKRRELPWCAGQIQNRSIAASAFTVLTPIAVYGDTSMVVGNTFTVRDAGVYVLHLRGGVTNGPSTLKVTGQLAVTSVSRGSSVSAITQMNSPSIPAMSTVVYLEDGDTTEARLYLSNAVSTIGTAYTFTFAQIG